MLSWVAAKTECQSIRKEVRRVQVNDNQCHHIFKVEFGEDKEYGCQRFSSSRMSIRKTQPKALEHDESKYSHVAVAGRGSLY